ncbi:MAG: caspase family protein, partial [Haliscomenobacter sp.]
MPENKDILREEGTPQPSPPLSGNTHLLVIAIDDYAHCPRLNNCVKDAKEFIHILDSRYGIAIDATLPPLFNGDATKRNIIYSFRKLAEKARPQDNVRRYFSGHGEYDKVLKQCYWVPLRPNSIEIKPLL